MAIILFNIAFLIAAVLGFDTELPYIEQYSSRVNDYNNINIENSYNPYYTDSSASTYLPASDIPDDKLYFYVCKLKNENSKQCFIDILLDDKNINYQESANKINDNHIIDEVNSKIFNNEDFVSPVDDFNSGNDITLKINSNLGSMLNGIKVLSADDLQQSSSKTWIENLKKIVNSNMLNQKQIEFNGEFDPSNLNNLNNYVVNSNNRFRNKNIQKKKKLLKTLMKYINQLADVAKASNINPASSIIQTNSIKLDTTQLTTSSKSSTIESLNREPYNSNSKSYMDKNSQLSDVRIDTPSNTIKTGELTNKATESLISSTTTEEKTNLQQNDNQNTSINSKSTTDTYTKRSSQSFSSSSTTTTTMPTLESRMSKLGLNNTKPSKEEENGVNFSDKLNKSKNPVLDVVNVENVETVDEQVQFLSEPVGGDNNLILSKRFNDDHRMNSTLGNCGTNIVDCELT